MHQTIYLFIYLSMCAQVMGIQGACAYVLSTHVAYALTHKAGLKNSPNRFWLLCFLHLGICYKRFAFALQLFNSVSICVCCGIRNWTIKKQLRRAALGDNIGECYFSKCSLTMRSRRRTPYPVAPFGLLGWPSPVQAVPAISMCTHGVSFSMKR